MDGCVRGFGLLKRGFGPATLSIVAAALSAAAVTGMAYYTRHSIERLTVATEANFEVLALQQEILRYDEGRLKAVALRMANVAGAWAERHLEAGEALPPLLQSLTSYSGDPDIMRVSANARMHFDELYFMERRALAYLDQNKLDKAQAWLADPDYVKAHDRFDDAVGDVVRLSTESLAGDIARARTQMACAGVAAVIVAALLTLMWAALFRQTAAAARQLESEKRRAEDAHALLSAHSERREASFFDDSPLPMIVIDASAAGRVAAQVRDDGIVDVGAWISTNSAFLQDVAAEMAVTRANPAIMELLSAPDADFIQKNTTFFFKEEFLALFLDYFDCLITGKPFDNRECAIYTLGKRRLDVIFRPRIARGSESSLDTLICTIIDVTDLKRVQTELEQARTAADAANLAKSRFLAAMSHEIRTPLNGVLGMAAALGQGHLTQSQRKKVEVIDQSGTALLAVLNDLLDLSKVEAGKLELERTPFELERVVGGAEALFGGRAKEKGLSFSVSVDEDARGVYDGDPTRVRQVLHNLIANAVKFTDEGSVRVRVSREATDVAGVARLAFTVQDTGVGIEPDALARLFTPFQQADSSMTRRFGGTGLGLAISRQLAELMGGSIEATSAPGEGSTFTFSAPFDEWGDRRLVEPTDVMGPEAVDASARSNAPMRILAAEDNTQNRVVLEALLEPSGADVTFVEDGRQAVNAWADSRFDLILMDIQMPEMNGLEATRAIRTRETREGRERTPIVALTANAMTHQVDEYLAVGMDGVIAKPIQPHKLFEGIVTAVAGVGAPTQAGEA